MKKDKMLKMDKKAFKIALWCIEIFIVFGIFVPYLLSASSTIFVLLGIFVFIVNILFIGIGVMNSKMYKKMKKYLMGLIVFVLLQGCTMEKVPSGHVGIKVYLLGSDKGVDIEPLTPGRYFIGVNEEVHIFPTFTQNYSWTKDARESSPNDESITFQTIEGMSVSADVGIAYKIQANMASDIFQKFRKGVDEITDEYMRNVVRDAINKQASMKEVEYVYGKGKSELIENVEKNVSDEMKKIGILVERISFIGSLRLPKRVVEALDKKIEATQRAQQRENELRESEAEAEKKIAHANGEAQARLAIEKVKADAILLNAKAQAKSNKLINDSLTKNLIQYQMINQWDGKLPTNLLGSSENIFHILK